MTGFVSAGTFSAIPDSAVNDWKLGEGSGSTAADSIGTNDLSITSASWISNLSGTGGYLLDFDGADDEANGTHPPALSGNEPHSFALTIDLDNSYTGGSGTQQIVHAAGAGGDPTFEISVGNDSTDGLEYESRKDDSSVQYRSGIDLSGESGFVRAVITHDGSGNTTVYLNGSSVTDQNFNGNNDSGDDVFVLGAGIGRNWWDGRMDRPIVYNTELTASEVQNDYAVQPWS